MALARILVRLKSRLRLVIEVVTVHHGNIGLESHSVGGRQSEFRDQAERLVVREMAKLDPEIPVHCLRVQTQQIGTNQIGTKQIGTKQVQILDQSEAAMRRARWELFQGLLVNAESKFDWLVFAHHADDLLETRLIRLLRGTGLQGLESMKTFAEVRGVSVWRPLLNVDAIALREYLKEAGWSAGKNWLEDPSNQQTTYLRNAIRLELIPLIEKIRLGGVKSLRRSLDTIVDEAKVRLESDNSRLKNHTKVSKRAEATVSKRAEATTLSRVELMNLSPQGRRQALSRWLMDQCVKDYSKAQIDEVLKRLDTPRKRLRFTLCGRVWIVDSQIKLVAPSQSLPVSLTD